MTIRRSEGPPREYRGSTSAEIAVRYLGRSSDGRVNLQLNVTVPETPDDDPPPTSRQIQAVQQLFPHVPGTISFGQAHAILCYRDYANAVIDRVLPDLDEDSRHLWLNIIATIVSHDERIAGDVRRWSGDRFKQARGDPRIVKTKHFRDLIVTCRDLAREMGMIQRIER